MSKKSKCVDYESHAWVPLKGQGYEEASVVNLCHSAHPYQNI